MIHRLSSFTSLPANIGGKFIFTVTLKTYIFLLQVLCNGKRKIIVIICQIDNVDIVQGNHNVLLVGTCDEIRINGKMYLGKRKTLLWLIQPEEGFCIRKTYLKCAVFTKILRPPGWFTNSKSLLTPHTETSSITGI